MYVDIMSVYLNYGNFRSGVGGVVKSSSTLPLAQLNNCNWLQQNYRYIAIYIESICNDFTDFRTCIICATIKIAITIENGWSLKICQNGTQSPQLPHLIHGQHQTNHKQMTRGVGVSREGVDRENERQGGCLVTR